MMLSRIINTNEQAQNEIQNDNEDKENYPNDSRSHGIGWL